MRLADYLQPEHIKIDLQGITRYQIIEELIALLDKSEVFSDAELALQDVLEREGYLSTGLESGLAIPHAKTDGVKGMTIALGIKKDGVDFESLDGKPANLIFLVLSPRTTSGPHIQTLAIISRSLKEQKTREALLKADSIQDVYDIISNRFSS